MTSLDKAFKPDILEAAHKNYGGGGIGVQQALLIFAHDNGYDGRWSIGQDNLRDVMRAAFSTHTLTTMLTSTGNKLLLEGFNAVPQTWRQVATVSSVNDFKTVTAFRLTDSFSYEEVGAGGDIPHGTMGQESYTMQVKTYAKLVALTRQDIINDDLGAFNQLRQKLGLGAAIKMNELFWTVWLTASSAGTFWTAARANLVTGSAFAEAGITTAVKAFRDMRGPSGNMMSLEPKFVLVPTDLEATALKWYSSQEIRDTTATTKFPTANIYQNRFRVIPVPELGTSTFTGWSATTWFLLADPAVLASATMAFLNNAQNPTIESSDADFDTLGIQIRAYHDFYPSMTEYRASVKATA